MTIFGKLQPASSFDTVLYGKVNRPAVIMVGVWDPLAVEHQELLSELATYAHAHNLCAVTILLDPAPPQFLLNDPWPVYEPPLVRIERMHRLGIDGTVVVSFTPYHLATSAAIFLANVSRHFTIAELWLGARQIFGKREPGSLEAILEVGRTSGFDVRQLDRETDLRRKGLQVRLRLASGCVAAAREIVGHTPIYVRSGEDAHRLAWAPGVYQVQMLDSLEMNPHFIRSMPLLLIKETNGYSRFAWPDPHAPYLAFLQGPHDLHRGSWAPDIASITARRWGMESVNSLRQRDAEQSPHPCLSTGVTLNA
jgi:hypothetical protein